MAFSGIRIKSVGRAQRGTAGISLGKENPRSPSRDSLKAFTFPERIQDRLPVTQTANPKLHPAGAALTAGE